MSLAKIRTSFEGNRVKHPRQLKMLQILIDVRSVNKPTIEKWGKIVHPEARVSEATTSDGYHWFCALRIPNGEEAAMVILFPFQSDFIYTDDSQSDRHIAMVGTLNIEALKRLQTLFKRGDFATY